MRLVLLADGLGSGGWVDERTGSWARLGAVVRNGACEPDAPVAGAEAGRLLSGRCRGAALSCGTLAEVSFGVRVEPAAECSGSAELVVESDSIDRVLRTFTRRTFFCLGGKGTAGRRPAGLVSSARSSRSLDVPCNATILSRTRSLQCLSSTRGGVAGQATSYLIAVGRGLSSAVSPTQRSRTHARVGRRRRGLFSAPSTAPRS